ncbi:squalene/phytoene synthase [Colletotrichum fioriniae PJ7]|uniref:Squalene/phytoene synthase n=1 Tax=Colletotrichum fioriniae PJ7 TaxID=1445577 RepID=A0A010R1J8_9PEZI|nr:squalene/phytoene synthase [Colletotrichum fioriniae PJ7]
MNRTTRIAGHGLRRLVQTPPRGTRGIVTDADVVKARKYCQSQLQHSDYDAHIISRLVPARATDTYLALRSLNLELVRLPELVSNPTIGQMRMQFWRDSIDKTFAGAPPAEPICVLLHQALQDLRARSPGNATASSIKFWVQRLVKTRAKHMDNRPYASLAALEEYAENTYSTLMYATLASMPLRSMQVDHLASHIGKACGIVAVLRGIPVLAAPQQQPAKSHAGPGGGRQDPALLLPLDVMAEVNLREEDVFRYGPQAEGFQDAVFKVATRANDHLITAREMLKNLKAGQDAGHEFEHEGEAEHVYEPEEDDTQRDLRRGFGVLLEAVPAQEYLTNLEGTNFDPWTVKPSWKLPWRLWRATSKSQI